jgi:hypothetical protein
MVDYPTTFIHAVAPSSVGKLLMLIFHTKHSSPFPFLVAARIIKGVFWAERGSRLPSDYDVIIYSTEGLRQLPQSVGLQLKSIVDTLLAREPRHVGGPQFLYWSDYNPLDPNQSTWLLVVHRHHFFIGWTVKAPLRKSGVGKRGLSVSPYQPSFRR